MSRRFGAVFETTELPVRVDPQGTIEQSYAQPMRAVSRSRVIIPLATIQTFSTVVITATLDLPDGTAAAPSLRFSNDTDSGLFRTGGDDWGLSAGGNEVLSVRTAGVDITGDIIMSTAVSQLVPGATSFALRNAVDGANNFIITNAGAATIRAGLTITAGGLICANEDGIVTGHTTQLTIGAVVPQLQVLGLTSVGDDQVAIGRWGANASSATLVFLKSRAATVGEFSVITSGDPLGRLNFIGDDGTDYGTVGGRIEVITEGTIGANRIPTRMIFFTGTNAVPTVVTEAFRLDSSQNATFAGNLTVSGTGPHAIGGATSGIVGLSVLGAFTSDASDSAAVGFRVSTALTGAGGDTTALIVTQIIGSVATQAAGEAVASISSLRIHEPNITNNLTGGGANVIDVAATVHIVDAPTEGVLNYALWVDAGESRFDGLVQTVATATGSAGLNLPHGTAPTSPVNGDLWTTTAGLFLRTNGSTVGPFTA